MNAKYKKSLKIGTLLITALLIATASAQLYRYMYISGTVSISSSGLKWVLGDEAPAGSSITGSTVTLSLPISNGTLANFTHVLYLQNLDAATYSLTINITDAADSSLYETDGFNMTLSYNSTGVFIDKLDVTTTDSYSGSITDTDIWEVSFEVYTKPDASGDDPFSVQFTYE